MIKPVLTSIVAVFIFSACSSAGQMQTSDTDSNTGDNSGTDDIAAPWYDHSKKAYSDSTEFVGMGMAIAADSSEAMKTSISQAREFLTYAIDSYAEEIRKDLAENSENSDFGSGSFILSLRQTVNGLQFLESDISSIVEYSVNNNNAVIAYTKISIPREVAINMLASAIGNSSFSNSLRESSAM